MENLLKEFGCLKRSPTPKEGGEGEEQGEKEERKEEEKRIRKEEEERGGEVGEWEAEEKKHYQSPKYK